MDWFDLLAIQGTLESLFQNYNSKASILQCSSLLYGPTLTSDPALTSCQVLGAEWARHCPYPPGCHKQVGEADVYIREKVAVPGVSCRHGPGPGGVWGKRNKLWYRWAVRTVLGIPSRSCQPQNTEQSNLIGARNLSLVGRDQGCVCVCVYTHYGRGGCPNSPDHKARGLWQPQSHGIHAGGATWDGNGISGLAWPWPSGKGQEWK